ncbi:MAG TPA: hypothetical protein PKK06_09765 [Phycisphaerae bacterium]|nr:hypothetical protein [Phycisphaerae bacterium]HNU45587.1 hypothetical protein [Phycisphaerae bacterium]
MRILVGKFPRTIDGKNRIQLPSELRAAIDPAQDGPGFFITLGEYPHTLSIYPERYFEELANRIETEYMPEDEPRRFELEFYMSARHMDIDAQGRVVLPDDLRTQARLPDEVYLVGQKHRIEVWNREDLERTTAIDWEAGEWPQWPRYIRMRPGGAGKPTSG